MQYNWGCIVETKIRNIQKIKQYNENHIIKPFNSPFLLLILAKGMYLKKSFLVTFVKICADHVPTLKFYWNLLNFNIKNKYS